MREVAIIGVGSTVFGKYKDTSAEELGRRAVEAALEDSGVSYDKVELACCANVYGGMCIGQSVMKEVGITRLDIVNVENACASGSTAFNIVYRVIASGECDVGVAFGVEKMTALAPAQLAPPETDLDANMGLLFPAFFALIMRRYLDRYGVTMEQVARVAVKNRHHGCLNPYAQYKDEITVNDVLSSRMIADPITMLQCCPNTDGAAAAVLCAADLATKYCSKPVRVAASVVSSGDYQWRQRDITFSDLTHRTAEKAYHVAGMKPDDIDVCELHDAFAVNELMHYEELGFCAVGEGGRLVESGATSLGGKIPVNVSGGLLSKGHPLAATGVAQLAEIVWQLRGEAGERQVNGAKVGLAHVLGGAVTGLESGACTVHILEKF
jgi:benzoylsuccinyl-CoA thiolase BbsB subunit